MLAVYVCDDESALVDALRANSDGELGWLAKTLLEASGIEAESISSEIASSPGSDPRSASALRSRCHGARVRDLSHHGDCRRLLSPGNLAGRVTGQVLDGPCTWIGSAPSSVAVLVA